MVIMKGVFLNALTIDVEDAINQAMRNYFGTEIEPTYRTCDNTMRLIDLLDEYDISATFFILGEVAAAHSNLIKEISIRGHELGIHGYSHTPYYKLSKTAVRDEIFKAKMLIEDITGKEVLGHRAPAFSINQKNLWVMDVLLEAGIKYDSSIFPVKTNRYGWSGFSKEISWLNLDDGRRIIEAPLTTINILGKDVPACGGGYMRVLPYFFTNYAFKKTLNQRPVNVYIHPYEIDLPPFQQFYMDAVRKSSLKNEIEIKAYWYNRKTVMPKLKRLLNAYKFDTLFNVINSILKLD